MRQFRKGKTMSCLRDHVWLWGQTPGSHHTSGVYKLPGVNRMTPVEGCRFFGIENCCRVAMADGPFPPFDSESRDLQDIKNVVWSIMGSGSVHRNEENGADFDEVVRQAKMFPNVIGGVMDDFLLSESRRAIFTPDVLRDMKARFSTEAGRPMEFWTVYYEREMDIDVKDYLEVFDVITFWTWYGKNLAALEDNLEATFRLVPGKRYIAGCYMWDYGDAGPLGVEVMEKQLETYRKYMHAGKLDGFILCSNCIADIGLEEVDFTRRWLEKYGDEEI